MTVSPPLKQVWSSEAQGLGQLESELARLERALALAQAEGESDVPARTSVLNLVVYAEDDAALEQASSTVAHLAGRHPSRTIYVLPSKTDTGNIESELSAHCLAGTESHPQVCVEDVRIRCGAVRPENLPELLTPLFIADLPIFAWIPGLSEVQPDVMRGLAQTADHIVIDTAGLTGGAQGLAALAPLGSKLVDFSWLRLLPLCELFAQFFDPEASRRYVDQLNSIQVEYAHPSSAAAVLLTAWLADRLGWEPFTEDRAPLVRFFRPDDEPGQYALTQLFPAARDDAEPGAILGMVAIAQRLTGAPAKFQIRRNPTGSSVETLARLPNGRQTVRVAPIPPSDASSLLADALDQLEPSLLYQDILGLAGRMVS